MNDNDRDDLVGVKVTLADGTVMHGTVKHEGSALVDLRAANGEAMVFPKGAHLALDVGQGAEWPERRTLLGIVTPPA